MDDPDHTRNPVILEEGVLPTKCSVCVMGILEVGSDYCSPPWLPPKKKKRKKSKNNSSGVKAAVRWQPVQRGARGRHPSVPSVHVSEGQSSAALHVAAVLFTSLWKPITSPRCCASQSCYISHTNTRKHALTQMRCAHAHTQTYTCSSNSSWLWWKARIMPSDLSVVKYIDVHTWNDYLQLRCIRRQVSECMKNDGLFTMGFYIGLNVRWL